MFKIGVKKLVAACIPWLYVSLAITAKKWVFTEYRIPPVTYFRQMKKIILLLSLAFPRIFGNKLAAGCPS